MRRAVRLGLLAGVLFGAPVMPFVAQAQQAAASVQASVPFRILNETRLLNESRLGQEVLARIDRARQALEDENQRLFDQLEAEESELTSLRATLSPDEFRTRAEAFDARVEEIRAERGQASDDLARRSEAEAQRFFDAALPVLVQLMTDEGLVALLKPETVILGTEWLDITDAAIARLDAAAPALPPPVEPDPSQPETPTPDGQ